MFNLNLCVSFYAAVDLEHVDEDLLGLQSVILSWVFYSDGSLTKFSGCLSIHACVQKYSNLEDKWKYIYEFLRPHNHYSHIAFWNNFGRI